MNKQKKQLLLMVILLLLLVLGYFGILKYNEWKAEKEEQETINNTFYVTNLEQDDINEITYEYEGETLTFVKEEDTWVYEGDTSLSIKQYRVNNMASNMAEIVAQQVLESVTDMEQYGLTDESRKVSFSTADESYSFLIGDYNSSASIYYWGVENEDTVYTVEGTYISCFGYTLDELVEEVEESSETTEESTEIEESAAETTAAE